MVFVFESDISRRDNKRAIRVLSRFVRVQSSASIRPFIQVLNTLGKGPIQTDAGSIRLVFTRELDMCTYTIVVITRVVT